MDFNRHSELADRHAFLSPSQYHWMNYSPEKLVDRYRKHQAAARGTRLHNLAHLAIQDGVRLANTGQTVNMYVNDCIDHRMKTEVVLAYYPPGRASYQVPKAFGTADAINYEAHIKTLRVFDLKTGETPTKVFQLWVYAALFCLEYKISPYDIEFYDLRIYQNDDVQVFEVEPDEIAFLVEWIKEAEGILNEVDGEV